MCPQRTFSEKRKVAKVALMPAKDYVDLLKKNPTKKNNGGKKKAKQTPVHVREQICVLCPGAISKPTVTALTWDRHKSHRGFCGAQLGFES